MDKMQQYFVTGGSGYVGRNLLRALVAQGHCVKALARSETSASVVRGLGAEPVMGDMMDESALLAGMQGADYMLHLAADTDHGLAAGGQLQTNQNGTRNVFEAAREAGVKRALHLSSEAVLLTGAPLVNADETTPIPARFSGGYSRSKAAAEVVALTSQAHGFEVVVLRPRFVWGRDDSTALPQLIDAAESGKLAWIDGGDYLTSTTHIDNAVVGMLLALEKGQAGAIYFVSDGEPVSFRSFVSQLLATQGVEPPSKNVPRWLVAPIVRLGDLAAKLTGAGCQGR